MENISNSISSDNLNLQDCGVDNLLSFIKDQTKELKITKKRLEKLEEKFIKTNADFKNVLNDKINLENFLKTVFPKEMHENLYKNEFGLYDTAELIKMYLVYDLKKQNEFGQFLNRYKNENADLTEKNKNLLKDADIKQSELILLKNQVENLMFLEKENSEVLKKLETLKNEKNYLLKIIDEKNQEVNSLIALEVENAELKAKNLLENLNINPGLNNFTLNSSRTSGNFGLIDSDTSNKLKIINLNVGCQTIDHVYSSEYVNDMERQIRELSKRIGNLKKDFSEYKEKSHKILVGNEDNYNRLLLENEKLKKEISGCKEIEKENGDAFNNSYNSRVSNITPDKIRHKKLQIFSDSQLLNEYVTLKNTLHLNVNGDTHTYSQKINLEYLKNVLLKYLEAFAVGNEFQIKILENVIFTILNISNVEKQKLEEKRIRSYFYYNLWYNAKAYFSEKLYGSPINFQESSSVNSVIICENEKYNTDKSVTNENGKIDIEDFEKK